MPTEFQRLRTEQRTTVQGPRRVYGQDPAVARERRKEASRRNAEARRRAWIVMQARHPEEAREVLEAERAGVNEERGPLPGDDDA